MSLYLCASAKLEGKLFTLVWYRDTHAKSGRKMVFTRPNIHMMLSVSSVSSETTYKFDLAIIYSTFSFTGVQSHQAHSTIVHINRILVSAGVDAPHRPPF